MGTSLFLIISAAFIQSTDFFLISGNKPNGVFITLLILVFFIRKIPQYAILVLIGGMSLSMSHEMYKDILIVMGIVCVAYLLHKKLPWRAHVTIGLFTLAGTLLIETSQVNMVIIAYNIILSLALFFIMQFVTGKKIIY